MVNENDEQMTYNDIIARIKELKQGLITTEDPMEKEIIYLKICSLTSTLKELDKSLMRVYRPGGNYDGCAKMRNPVKAEYCRALHYLWDCINGMWKKLVP